jgi:hypothetical protein
MSGKNMQRRCNEEIEWPQFTNSYNLWFVGQAAVAPCASTCVDAGLDPGERSPAAAKQKKAAVKNHCGF